jgi:hypothetical protein
LGVRISPGAPVFGPCQARILLWAVGLSPRIGQRFTRVFTRCSVRPSDRWPWRTWLGRCQGIVLDVNVVPALVFAIRTAAGQRHPCGSRTQAAYAAPAGSQDIARGVSMSPQVGELNLPSVDDFDRRDLVAHAEPTYRGFQPGADSIQLLISPATRVGHEV